MPENQDANLLPSSSLPSQAVEPARALDQQSQATVTIAQLQTSVAEFCEARNWGQFHHIKDLAIGAVTEASELLEIFRFRSAKECEEFFQVPSERVKIEDELADVLFFLLRISERYEVDLVQAFSNKMLKNAERYPANKSFGKNQKYDAL